MTNEKAKREKIFSEELPYFKERIQEVLDNYDNLNGNEDPLYIAVLRDSKRIVRKAEEEFARQQEEIENLTYTLLGVMHSVDKWLDGTELEQDEVNRSVTMREKTLRIVEEKQAEIERLKIENQAFRSAANSYKLHYNEARTEAVKEFAKRLKEKAMQKFDWNEYVEVEEIDNIVKEMVGDNSNE